MKKLNLRRLVTCLLLTVSVLFSMTPVLADYSSEISAADAKIATAEKELATLQNDLAGKKAAYEEKQAAYDQTMSASANSLLGWLEDTENGMGWTNATSYFNSITDSGYSDTSGKAITAYTSIGANNDATSLTCVKSSLEFIKECNTLRSGEGASVLQVSARMMLEAAITANYVKTVTFEHPLVFDCAENIAGGYSDPFAGWYTEEKNNYVTGNGGMTGHYLNIIDKSYVLTGFGTAYGGGYGAYHVQDFNWSDSNNTTTMSVTTAVSKLNSYTTALSSKQTSAKSAMENAKSAYDKAQTAVTNKQNEIASLQAAKTALIPTSVKIEEEFYAMKVGATKTLTTTVTPATAINEATFTSSDSSVVSVTAAGKLTAKKAGTATITAKTPNGKTNSITVRVTTDTPVYRLYLGTGEHLYTTDANEVETLWKKYGWAYEGVGWYAKDSGTPVYRLYNKGLANHLYTTDTNEVKVLTSKYGWQKDNNGEPLFYSSGSVNVYRVYNKGLNGMHHMTTDLNEYNTLPKFGWAQEGAKIKASALGDQIVTNYFGK